MQEWTADLLKLGRIFLQEEPIMVVLRAHLLVEQYLTSYIAVRLPDLPDDALRGQSLAFRSKVDLAHALGAFEFDHRRKYLAVASLRNKLAHNLDREVTPDDERDLHNALAPAQRFIHDSPVEQPAAGRFPASLRDSLLSLVEESRLAVLDAQEQGPCQ